MVCCCFGLPSLPCIKTEFRRVQILLLMTAVVFGSTIVMLWQNYTSYDEMSTKENNGIYAESQVGTVCKIVVSIATVLQLYFVYDFWSARARRAGHKSIWAAGYTKWFLIEFIINAIHVPPFLSLPSHKHPIGGYEQQPCAWDNIGLSGLHREGDWPTSEYPLAGTKCKEAHQLYRQFSTSYDELSVFVILRFYHLLRWMHQKNSLYRISKAPGVNMGDIGNKTGIHNVNMFFVLRCYFQQSPWKCAWYCTSFALLSFAYIVYVFERVVQPEDWGTQWGVFAAVYWAAITMTSTGYGDFVPRRLIARFVTATSSLVGLLLSATFVFAMMKSVQLKPTELSALKWLHDKINEREEKRYVESRNSTKATVNSDGSRKSMVGRVAATWRDALQSPKKTRRFSFLDPNLESLRLLKQRQQSANKNVQDIRFQLAEIKALIRNEEAPRRSEIQADQVEDLQAPNDHEQKTNRATHASPNGNLSRVVPVAAEFRSGDVDAIAEERHDEIELPSRGGVSDSNADSSMGGMDPLGCDIVGDNEFERIASQAIASQEMNFRGSVDSLILTGSFVQDNLRDNLR